MEQPELDIPSQLDNWQLLLLRPGGKIPIGEMRGWADNREKITAKAESPSLRNHLNNGGNYGVCADKDRFIIACDTKEVEAAIEANLPKTFSVRSPRHKTKHFYFYGEITKTIHCTPTKDGDPCADIRTGNSYVVGPGSILNDYGVYEVADNLPITTVTEEAVIQAIKPFIKKLTDKNEPIITTQPTVSRKGFERLEFPITNLFDTIGFSKSGEEIRGPHPKHDSTTGTNFYVNPKKNIWHCFRHNTGGGPLELLAVMGDIITCEDAGKGSLRGDTFNKTVQLAEQRGLVKPLLQKSVGVVEAVGVQALSYPNQEYNDNSQYNKEEENTPTTQTTPTEKYTVYEICPNKLLIEQKNDPSKTRRVTCNGKLEKDKTNKDLYRCTNPECKRTWNVEELRLSSFFDEESFRAKRLADYLRAQGERFFSTSMRSDVYHYHPDKGVWIPDGDTFIHTRCAQLLKDQFKTHHFTETLSYIRALTYISPDKIGGPITKVPVANGVLDLETKTLENFNPDYYFITYLPVNYDETATCPAIDKFTGEIVGPEDVDKLYEIAGWCLRRNYWLARIIILEGSGRNGKGKYLLLLTAFLGKENISSVELQQLTSEGFKAACLYGKSANICGDIPSNAMRLVGMLKQLSGEDYITAQQKFKDPFQFRNYAKLVFAANILPASYEDTDAIYERLVTIPFPNKFLPNDPKTDPDILDKITTPTELSGFLNKALDGLQRLLKQKRFTNEHTLEDRRTEYLKKANPVQYFAETFLEQDLEPKAYISKDEMYGRYVTLCNELGVTPIPKNKFGGELPRWASYTYAGKAIDADSGERIEAWRAVRFKVQLSLPTKPEPPTLDEHTCARCNQKYTGEGIGLPYHPGIVCKKCADILKEEMRR